MGMDIFWFDDEMSRQAQTVRERTIIIISSDTIDMLHNVAFVPVGKGLLSRFPNRDYESETKGGDL